MLSESSDLVAEQAFPGFIGAFFFGRAGDIILLQVATVSLSHDVFDLAFAGLLYQE